MEVLIVFLLCLGLYFAPTGIGAYRQKSNSTPIFVVNLFLGWTFLGWVVALTWAVAGKRGA